MDFLISIRNDFFQIQLRTKPINKFEYFAL